MRNTFANVFYEEAKKDSRLCVVVADISPAGSMEKLRKEYPQRFVLHEGQAVQAFSAPDLLANHRVTPYDAFAVWMHAIRSRTP